MFRAPFPPSPCFLFRMGGVEMPLARKFCCTASQKIINTWFVTILCQKSGVWGMTNTPIAILEKKGDGEETADNFSLIRYITMFLKVICNIDL